MKVAATMASRLSQKSSLSAPVDSWREVIHTWARLMKRGTIAATSPKAINQAAPLFHSTFALRA